jgi:GTP-binding protein
MDIVSAKFVKGIIGPDTLLEGDLPQIAFIGRSNAGKSTLINSLTKQKNLARTSSSPGRTQEINLFLINDSFYLLDLPGYGYAKASKETRDELQKVIHGYLFDSPYDQKKVVLVMDANVGLTALDLEMINLLEEHEKNILVVANKIDKVKPSEYKKKMTTIQTEVGPHLVIPYSSEKKIGRKELLREII